MILEKKCVGNLLVDRSLSHKMQVINVDGRSLDHSYLNYVFEESIKKRKRIMNMKDEYNAFRLIYGASDGLPGMSIDVYGCRALITLYSQFLEFFVKPFSKLLMNNTERKIDVVCFLGLFFESYT